MTEKLECKCGKSLEHTNLKICLRCFVDQQLERNKVIYDRLAEI